MINNIIIQKVSKKEFIKLLTSKKYIEIMKVCYNFILLYFF